MTSIPSGSKFHFLNAPFLVSGILLARDWEAKYQYDESQPSCALKLSRCVRVQFFPEPLAITPGPNYYICTYLFKIISLYSVSIARIECSMFVFCIRSIGKVVLLT